MKNAAIERLIHQKGGQQALAKVLGVSQGTVSKWASGAVPVPPKKRALINERCGVNLSLKALRPDLF